MVPLGGPNFAIDSKLMSTEWDFGRKDQKNTVLHELKRLHLFGMGSPIDE